MRDAEHDETTATGQQGRVAAKAPDPLTPASVADRYRIQSLIGRGGMGSVYRAHDTTLDRDVAVKLLHSDHSERLVEEAQTLARLAHPNVVTVYDAGRTGEDVYLVMEHVQGRDLKRVLAHELAWRTALGLFRQAGDGLAAAHRAGIVHRDFKPSNVLVGDDDRVRVGDFGLAIAAGSTSESSAGTPHYLAPERRDGGAADARSDQFSFCVALYEALYRVRPFLDGSTLARPRPAGSAVPRSIHRAVQRGLSIDPARRFGSMDELLAALRPPARRAPKIAALTVLCVGALVAGIVVSRTRTATSTDPTPRAAASGEADPAVAKILATVAEVDRANGSGSLEAARKRADIATVVRLSGRHATVARDLYEQAISGLRATKAPTLEVASAEYWLAYMLLGEARAAEAVALSDDALARVVAGGATPKEIAETRVMLARALYEAKLRDRAMAVAQEAYDDAVRLGDEELRRRIDAYLSTNGERTFEEVGKEARTP